MTNIEIEDCDNFKDIGILYTDKRKFNNHICSKAYIIINIIFRSFATNNDSSTLKDYITCSFNNSNITLPFGTQVIILRAL